VRKEGRREGGEEGLKLANSASMHDSKPRLIYLI